MLLDCHRGTTNSSSSWEVFWRWAKKCSSKFCWVNSSSHCHYLCMPIAS